MSDDSKPAKSVPPKNSPPKGIVPTVRDVITDCVALVILGQLVFFDKMPWQYGAFLIAFIVGLRIPSKGSGVVTMLWPILSQVKGIKLPFISLVALAAVLSCSVLTGPAEDIISKRTQSDTLVALTETICLAAQAPEEQCAELAKLHSAFVDAWSAAARAVEVAAALEQAGSDRAPDAAAEAILAHAEMSRAWERYRRLATIELDATQGRTVVLDGGTS